MRKFHSPAPDSHPVTGALVHHLRLPEPIGCIPPAEAEPHYWQQLAQNTKTARSI